MRAIDADALEELFREVIGNIAKKPEMTGSLEHMVRASAMVIEMIKDAPTIEPEKQPDDTVSSHSEKEILKGCIALIDEMVGYFKDYLDFVGYVPESEEEKMPFVMSYFHIVNRLFLWNTTHSGGNSTRKKCYELGIEDSSENAEFYFWEDEEDGE